MKAYLITIGDEILIGQTVNTNVSFIGEKLTEIDVQVIKSIVIADDHNIIIDEFKEAFSKADVIIVTGGLGPTHDDVTKKCISEFFNSELVMNESILNDVKELFIKRGREITKINEEQALIPKIAKAIRNPNGTAPGIYIEKEGKVFVAMPGVPFEMQYMLEENVIPALSELNSVKVETSKTLNLLTTGIPESFLYQRLGDIDELLNGSRLAFLPNQFGVKMRITSKGKTEEEASNKLLEIEQKIRSLVGRYVYGKNNDSLEEVIAKLLVDRGLKLSVAESCTGGLISNRLTNIPGSSAFFERGLITYSNGAKVEHLNVSEDAIAEFGAVSLQVAQQMAEGIRAVSGTDLGLAVTGIMGPGGGSADKPIGLVYIGVCDNSVVTAKEFKFGDNRLLNKDRTSQAALEMLRRFLLGIPND
ncbi:MAG: competence/damage-inducible protein A [Melioribacteraceae bacterium]|nr:competence/damage-inducible protein A [Melioribacteraceae bacterium]